MLHTATLFGTDYLKKKPNTSMGMLPHPMNFEVKATMNISTVQLQLLEHRCLVYHGYFELVLESLGKILMAADIIIIGII